MAPPPNSNLYCTSCDSQIGVFENEWTHFTTSYAKSQEKGTHLGTEIGVKTQVVPVGSAQKDAEGCEMSEVYCTKCSSVVAQYCRTAPEPSQQHFVGQHFYKVSRVYLKDSHTSLGIDMNFIDGDGAQSQRVLNSATSSSVPRQRLPSARAASDVPFRQSFPPPAGQSWQWPSTQAYFSKPIAPNDFRSASAQPMLDCRHDQLAPLAECANRITATDMRLANQEMRFNTSQEKFHNLELRVAKYVERLDSLETDFDSTESKLKTLKCRCEQMESCIDEQDDKIDSQGGKLELLDGDQSQLEAYFHEQDDVVKEQQRKIEEQDQELRRITAKLEELEDVIDGLKATINENRTQHLSIPRTTPYPPSTDFLESLEVMVKAMKSTQSDSDELRVLREENRAMKTRLRTIAGAIGLASGKDSNACNDENIVLGKRKRAAVYDTVQQRKMSRHSNGSPAELTQSASALPTPDSSQNKASFLADAQNRGETGIERSTDNAEQDVDLAKTVEGLDENVIQIVDDDEEMMEQAEHDESNSSRTKVVADNTGPLPESPELVTYGGKAPITVPSGHARVISTQQAKYSAMDPEYSAQSVPLREELTLPSKAIQSTNPISMTTKVIRSRPSKIARASFTSSRPVSMMERMRSPSVRNSPAPLPFSAQSFLPPSQVDTASDRASQSGLEKSSDFRRQETFSGAISRGDTLQNVVQRTQYSHSPHADSISQHRIATTEQQRPSQQKPPELQSQVLQPCQHSRLNTPHAGVQSSNAVESSNVFPVAESVEFSDDENEPSNNQKEIHHEKTAKPSTSEQKIRPTLISRTIPGVTFEPLVRPVIEHEINDNSRAGSRRQSTSIVQIPGAGPIMPEILAAIKNLNDCAVSQQAKTTFSTPNPRSTRTKGPAKNPKKIRKSEPISRQMTENLSNIDRPEPSNTITRSKSSANDTIHKISAPAMTSTIPDADSDPHLLGASSDPATKTIENTSALLTQGRVINRVETLQVETPEEQEPKKVNSTRKSLSRQQLLKERNRLAMEAMEREEAGQRFTKVTV